MAPGGRPPAAPEATPGTKGDGRGRPPVNRPPPVIAPGEGAESIDAVVKQLQTAAAAGKAGAILSAVYPDDRTEFAQGLAMVLAFSTLSHMDDPKAAEKAQKDIDALFARQKVEPPFNRGPDESFKNVNLVAFVGEPLTLLRSQLKKGEDPAGALPIPKGKPQDIKITGDAAVAQIDGRDVTFTRASGRWFIRLK